MRWSPQLKRGAPSEPGSCSTPPRFATIRLNFAQRRRARPNEHEAHELTGMPVGNMVDAVEAAQALQEKGPSCVIITRGDKGAVWTSPEGSGQSAAFKVSPVDTVAAGMPSAAVWRRVWLEAPPWRKPCVGSSRRGSRRHHQGAVPSLPSLEKVTELLER